jgi:hypothetical protein
VKQDYELHTGRNVLPYNKIERIDVLDKDTGRTVASHVLGTIGIIAGVFVVISIIAILTKSSCPFIYTYNGEHYDFQGEIYSGAFHAPLERHDFMPLPGYIPHQGAYRIKISNELKERQFIDLAELIVMEHGMDEKVLIDKYSKYHSITNPQAPLHAYSTKGTDITSTLKNRDGHCYLFNDPQAGQPLEHTILQFTKPEGIKKAKLVVSGKGSLWLDYVYGEFTKLFGDNYNAWCEKQKKEKPEVLQKRRIDNHIPIEVCLWEHGEWKYLDHFELVGPLGHARDMVLPVDLSGVDEDKITIRLRTGFFFWEVDYAGLDFSQDRVVKKMTIRASRAHDQLGNDVEQTLAEEDHSYLEQQRIGEYTELFFPAPALRADRDYSVFLHTKGYYEHIRQYDSAPQLAKLITFYIPGRFAAYSRELYQERHELFRTLDEPVILSSDREQRENIQ